MRNRFKTASFILIPLWLGILQSMAAANPSIPFYGYGAITATPHYPIVGESTEIAVQVSNTGDATATDVEVRVSFNDWGVTFSGWQEIVTAIIPSIAPGDTETATVSHIFENRAHTCVEVVIVDASENAITTDDRGQINLEVIHSGETFSYGVPIRNDGDERLELLICGGVLRDDPNGEGNKDCDDRNGEPVVLLPGEEIIVPVEVKVLPGEIVVFRIDAFNLAAADPFAPENHNHIELHIIGTTAADLKWKAMTTVLDLAETAADRSLKNRLRNLANHINHALTAKAWIDPNRLSQKGAAKVFAQEIAALNLVRGLLASDLDVGTKDTLNGVALQLADADRILAQTANSDAGGVVASTDFIAAGDKHRESGEYADAVRDYASAWRAAID